jgi:hypothetical protein
MNLKLNFIKIDILLNSLKEEMNAVISDIIIADIKDMVESLFTMYNSTYTLYWLYNRYIPNISIQNNKPKKSIKSKAVYKKNIYQIQ